MIQVWILVLVLFYSQAHASEFNHIKLNPQFEMYLNQPKMKSMQKSVVAGTAANDFSGKIKSTLLGANTTAKADFNSPFPTDGEESPLYEEIRNQLEASHQEIGLREVSNLDFINQQFNLGTQNFSGFSWQKPFGVVNVHADRQVQAPLLTDEWVVQDTFTLDIEASTFLEQANEAGITNMSQAEIGAFAGITFKRVYTYWHMAKDFQTGLRSDFSKLFLSFLRMNPRGMNSMLDGEVMKREDYWTVSAGGLITTPPVYNLSLSAGILAQFAYEHMVAVQNTDVDDETSEKFRLSVKSKKNASVGATMSLQLDFFKLLKLTILNADLNYEYAQGKEFTLGLSRPEYQHVLTDNAQGPELRAILNGFGQVKSLENYVIRLDETDSSSLQARGSLLVWGKLQKSKTEQVRTIANNVVKVFYKNYSQSVRVVQNVFSRLFSAVVYKLLKLPVGTKNSALYNRQLELEYEATHPQASNPDIARVDGTEQFSLVLSQSYEAASTHRWIDQKFKNDMIWFVDAYSTLPKDYLSIIRSNQLRGPMIVESNLRVEKAGLDYFLSQSEDKVFGYIAKVCDSIKAYAWTDANDRKKMLSRLQIGEEACVKNIGLNFLAFKQDYQANYLKPSLAKFKAFLTKYYKRAESLSDLQVLFGEFGFVNGQIKAKTSKGDDFLTSFSSGQFRGLGVIDTYKRSTGSRTPASIVSE